jgi:hypothetical protein
MSAPENKDDKQAASAEEKKPAVPKKKATLLKKGETLDGQPVKSDTAKPEKKDQ